MTDKQIMIDGVDVSKCMFFNKNYKEDDVQIKNFCELQYISCKEFDCANCYFKKWKRKEQECKTLKEGYSKLTDIVSSYMDDFTGYNEELGGFDIVLCVKELMEQLDQLKKTNEELQKDNEELRKCYKNNSTLLDFEETNTTKLVNKVMKLEKTLAEIKEIAECMHDLWINKTPYTDIDNLVKHLLECELNRIRYKLDEVSECEVKND